MTACDQGPGVYCSSTPYQLHDTCGGARKRVPRVRAGMAFFSAFCSKDAVRNSIGAGLVITNWTSSVCKTDNFVINSSSFSVCDSPLPEASEWKCE